MPNWKHALVTGAGSGLGHGIAERLLVDGVLVSVFDLAIGDKRRAELDSAAARGRAQWQFLFADVTRLETVQAAVDKAIATFGHANLAVHFAGVGAATAFADLDDAEFYRVMTINVNGSYHFARAVLPHMGKGDHLALTASMAGITSNYGYTSYGTSKFAVYGLATTLRLEYEPRGLRISCICPPEVMTPMVEAEHAIGDPVSIAVKRVAGSLSPKEGCDGIYAGLKAGRWLIIPGFKARATAFAARRMPGLFHAITIGVIRKVMRKHGRETA
jgi:NAD(P)-dependent dehydrogenase (short-subunit alcohol dehydrogenase family)